MRAFLSLLLLVALAVALDPYEVLGVPKDADEKAVKSAYRQLSKKYHPDKNPTEEAHDRFIEIGEAYEILSDETKRSNYDRFGTPEGQPQNNFDFGNIVNQFFGGQAGHHQQQGRRRGGDTQANLHVQLSDFYNGQELEFDVEMANICSKCEGTGSHDKKKHVCLKCGGHGFVTMRRQFGPGMVQTMQAQCDECQGKGQKVTLPCKECRGNGARPESRHYDIYMRPGFRRNDNHILEGEGDQNPDWTPGNLVITLREDYKRSWGYRRIGNHLYRTEVLSLKEATGGGWNRTIPFFDKIENEIHLHREKGVVVVDGEVQTIEGKGMPFPDDEDHHGNLYVEWRVLVPGGKAAQAIHDEL